MAEPAQPVAAATAEPPPAESESGRLLHVPLSGANDTDSPRAKSSIVSFATDQVVVVDGKSLSIQSDSIVLKDQPSKTKKGHAAKHQSVPLYNVLWAEVASGTLTIDYAKRASKTKLRPARWTLKVKGDAEPDVAAWAEVVMERAYGQAQRRKRAKVLVNPHAGPGGADKLWAHDVKPIFDAARMPFDVVRTVYSGEAVKLAEELDISAYDMVVACSGDGLPHEVLNGLARRPDARAALRRMAVAHIPCGSGNAMSCNLYGTHHASLAALAIVKGVPTPMDLVSVTQGDTRTVSFLSQALGIVAESDLGTENMRWMGAARFTYGILTRIFAKKMYPCDVAVKVEIASKDEVRAHYARNMSQPSLPVPRESKNPDSSTATLGDSAGGRGEGETETEKAGLPPLRYGTIKDPVPDGWEVIPHDKLGNFYCGNMAWMAPDAPFFTAACMADGYMDLVCVDGDLSPLTAVKLLLSVESGGFFDHPLVSYRKVSAYRVVPRGQKDGYISIDGERAPFAPFQAEIHQGLATVISKRGVYEAPGPRDWDKVTLAERLHA